MRKFLFTILIILLIFFLLGGSLNYNKDNVNLKNNEAFLRIHIRANSNNEEDQNIKYKVKTKLVDYFTPLICDCTTKDKAMSVIENNKQSAIKLAEEVLVDGGFDYGCNIKINNEEFPTRSYNDLTLESGFYDAVIVELGEAKGDNWWCVVYPPLCFADFEYGKNIIYKSKIVEIIANFFANY